jgi:hypothetical protein
MLSPLRKELEWRIKPGLTSTPNRWISFLEKVKESMSQVRLSIEEVILPGTGEFVRYANKLPIVCPIVEEVLRIRSKAINKALAG